MARKKLSPAAQLAKLRWANTTTEERSAHGRMMVEARGKSSGGRPRGETPRCNCGVMTAKRAVARGHRCDPPA